MSILPARALPLDATLSPQLAFDLAAGLRPAKEVCAAHGLTTNELRQLLAVPAFKAMVAEAKAKWSSDMSAETRVRAKAALAVEDTISDLHAIIVDTSVRANFRSDAFMKLARVAQLDSPADGATPNGYSLTINLPSSGGMLPPGPMNNGGNQITIDMPVDEQEV